tara:strand:+ start:415 stop:540 length:126 start_codon:yes stop_codon:yes gene_type:complete
MYGMVSPKKNIKTLKPKVKKALKPIKAKKGIKLKSKKPKGY